MLVCEKCGFYAKMNLNPTFLHKDSINGKFSNLLSHSQTNNCEFRQIKAKKKIQTISGITAVDGRIFVLKTHIGFFFSNHLKQAYTIQRRNNNQFERKKREIFNWLLTVKAKCARKFNSEKSSISHLHFILYARFDNCVCGRRVYGEHRTRYTMNTLH